MGMNIIGMKLEARPLKEDIMNKDVCTLNQVDTNDT